VTGAVIRDCGSHAFVPHQSHGVTFRKCISHNTVDDPYWYHQRPDGPYSLAPPTNDALYDRCVASFVQHDPPFRGFSMGGFVLGADLWQPRHRLRSRRGPGNRLGWLRLARVQRGDLGLRGLCRPQQQVPRHLCLAEQRPPPPRQSLRGLPQRGNGNLPWCLRERLPLQGSILYSNRASSLELHALSRPDLRLTFQNVLFDQAGLTGYCVVTKRHNLPAEAPVRFDGCHFRGHTHAALGFLTDETSEPESFELLDSTFEGNQFWLASNIHSESIIYVLGASDGNIPLRRFDQPGLLRPEWSASVMPTG
jgi:hypothetical protein